MRLLAAWCICAEGDSERLGETESIWPSEFFRLPTFLLWGAAELELMGFEVVGCDCACCGLVSSPVLDDARSGNGNLRPGRRDSLAVSEGVSSSFLWCDRDVGFVGGGGDMRAGSVHRLDWDGGDLSPCGRSFFRSIGVGGVKNALQSQLG